MCRLKGKFDTQFDVLLVDQDIQFQNTPNFRANCFRIFLWKYIHPWLGYPKPEDSSYSANLTFPKVGLTKQDSLPRIYRLDVKSPRGEKTALPLLPPLPPEPRCRESDVKRKQKRDASWKKPLHTDF